MCRIIAGIVGDIAKVEDLSGSELACARLKEATRESSRKTLGGGRGGHSGKK